MYMVTASPMATNLCYISWAVLHYIQDDCFCQGEKYPCKENQIVVPPQRNTPNPSRDHAENHRAERQNQESGEHSNQFGCEAVVQIWTELLSKALNSC